MIPQARLGAQGLVLAMAAALSACESANEHFCAKYSFFYKELTAPGVMPHRDIETQLRSELNDPEMDPDRARIGLFVLRDIVNDIKPRGEEPLEYCMRRRLWEKYQ